MFFLLIKIIYIIINVLIGIYDFSFYRIPNSLLALLLILYGLFAPFLLSTNDLVNSLIVFVLTLAIGLALFAAKLIGAGDAKYVSVIALWAGFPGVLQFLFFTTMIGGILAVLFLLLRDHIGRFSDYIWSNFQKAEKHIPILQYVWVGSGVGPERGERDNISSKVIPYGVAIAAGAIIVMQLHPLVR
ncbi:MAG: prepilin peptidase [Proteobacteria bacterium]|nr:prepilin peptidase [Pseudomonadota bacterium]